jgi:hypothetical protein
VPPPEALPAPLALGEPEAAGGRVGAAEAEALPEAPLDGRAPPLSDALGDSEREGVPCGVAGALRVGGSGVPVGAGDPRPLAVGAEEGEGGAEAGAVAEGEGEPLPAAEPRAEAEGEAVGAPLRVALGEGVPAAALRVPPPSSVGDALPVPPPAPSREPLAGAVTKGEALPLPLPVAACAVGEGEARPLRVGASAPVATPLALALPVAEGEGEGRPLGGAEGLPLRALSLGAAGVGDAPLEGPLEAEAEGEAAAEALPPPREADAGGEALPLPLPTPPLPEEVEAQAEALTVREGGADAEGDVEAADEGSGGGVSVPERLGAAVREGTLLGERNAEERGDGVSRGEGACGALPAGDGEPRGEPL